MIVVVSRERKIGGFCRERKWGFETEGDSRV